MFKIRLDKNTFVKTEGRQTSNSRAGALFLKKKKPWCWKNQFIACFPVIVFSATLIWLKKYFCLPAAAPENGANRCPWKEIQDIQAWILQPASLYFRSALPRRRYYDEKNFFLLFFENLTKYITNAGYLNKKNFPRLITNIPKWMLTGINLLLFTSQWYLDK